MMRKERMWCAMLAALALCACAPDAGGKAAQAGHGGGVAQSAVVGEDAGYGRDFALHDTEGVPVRLADFRGKVLAVFFGYTSCPDVCPTALLKLREALGQLSPQEQAGVAVRFVTLDPERDKPAVLKGYLAAFGPQFHGLTGSPEEVAAAAREFRVVYRKNVQPGSDFYTIDHSTGIFLFDAAGKLRRVAPHALPAAQLAQDVRALLGQ